MNEVVRDKIKIICLLCVVVLFFLPSNAKSKEWEVDKGTHFIIYHKDAPFDFVKKVHRKAEHYYKKITHNLGYRRFNFWTWDNRCKIYLYSSKKEYLKHIPRRSWSRGHVNVMTKEIKTFLGQKKFFDVILPHEMTHIIFREFIGFKRRLPLCIDEGVACIQEESKVVRLSFIKRLMRWNIYIPLNKLFEITDANFIIPVIFYNESASIMNFLLSEYAREKFVKFSRDIIDGEYYKESLFKIYNFESFKDMENKWLNWLNDVKLDSVKY